MILGMRIQFGELSFDSGIGLGSAEIISNKKTKDNIDIYNKYKIVILIYQ